MTNLTSLNRAQGALLGLAAGDALGTTLEFGPRIANEEDYLRDIVGGGPFKLKPGQWTDDTSMALALADSLIASGGTVRPADLLGRFANWYRHGENSCTGKCFDIGNQTRAALEAFAVQGRLSSGEQKHKQGNGGIMRLAPAAIVARTQTESVKISRAQSETTHASPHCMEFAGDLGKLLFQLIDGDTSGLDRYRSFHWVACGRDDVLSTGQALNTFRAALWAVCRTSTFRDAVIEAVNLGDDADTVGAVTGQIAGALYGRDGIPKEWLERLSWAEDIQGRATELYLLRGRGTAASAA